MSDKELIIPSGIPQFIGNLGTLETDTKALTADAKLFRDSGASVHSTFQGLSACYKAPEADKLFATTAPVATKSDAFADDLEKVSSALSSYASTVRPLADRLGSLKEEAVAFVSSVEGDDHWRRDKKKVEHNNTLWHSVNATVAAFHDAERACHDKIVALVKGGTPLIPDDGSHKPNMYGYKASDLDHAEKTPWGSMAEREYTGLAWLGHQVKSFVWDGFIVDGVWGTITGLGTLVGTDGWDKAGQAWTGLGKLATGLVISSSPLGAAYWLLPDDKLPRWVRDSRTAVKETGKALVAYDQWGKNPARAAGGVTFNVLTTVFTGGSGTAAKGGAIAKTVSVLGKAGRIVDPITYVGKAAKFGYVKVGDLLSGLKNLRVGTTVHIADEAFRVPGDAATPALPKRPANLPEDVSTFLDHNDKPVYMDKKTGALYDEHGKEFQPAKDVKKELSAEERSAAAKQPEVRTQRDPLLVGAGARSGGDVRASVGHGGEHVPAHGAGGAGGHAPGGSADHMPRGSADHTPGGAASHAPGGSAHHTPGGSAHSGENLPPRAGHETPSGSGGSGGHGTPTHPAHDTPGSGTSGHNGGSHGGHDSPSGPHDHEAPRPADDARPPHDGSHGNGHDAPSGNTHNGDGAHTPETGGPNHSAPGDAHVPGDATPPPHAPGPPRQPVGDLIPGGKGTQLTPEQLQEQLQKALDGNYGGLRIKIEGVYPSDNVLGWSASLVDEAGHSVGRMERDFIRKEDGTLAVKHMIMKIDDPAFRGKGVGTAISRELENWYRQSGVSEIRLTAGKENGAYTWARRGYSWADEKSAKKIINRINVKMRDAEWSLTKEEFEAAQDIVNRARTNPFGSPNYPAPIEISRIGRGTGRDDFFGKRVLVKQNWEGRKQL
ncbi:hypothetical protein AB0F13_01985 [Streptomyces sp. NPDC026206]|uniref:hypothetical protein n=1 Tax=Streptomyces sp. NPDC026206 TaxID=3157089 RepID=UPI0033D222D3